MGVAGYPALGIYKSIRSSVRDGTRNAIALRRFDEAVWTVDKIENLDGVAGKVLDAFNVLIHG